MEKLSPLYLNRYIKIILLGFIIIKSSLGYSQATFEGIKDFQNEYFGSFSDEKNKVNGFYLINPLSQFYDKKAIFQLTILDTNFNKKSVVELELLRNSSLMDIVASGDVVMTFFVNNKGYEYYTCNFNGEVLAYKFVPKNEINNKEFNFIYQNTNKGISFSYLQPISGNNFIRQTHAIDKKYHKIKIICLDSKLNEIWSYSPLEQRKEVEDVELNYEDKNQIIFTISERKFIDAQIVQHKILCLNPVDGSVKYLLDLVNKEKGNRSVRRVFCQQGKVYITGEYYLVGKHIQYDESEGLYFYTINEQGEILTSKDLSWNTYESLLANKEVVKQKSIDKYSLYFHGLNFIDSGNIYFIGEQYRKKVSLGGTMINAAVGFQVTSYFEIEFGDLVVLEFDQNFLLKDAKRIEKVHHSKLIKGWEGALSADYYANKFKRQGKFDLKIIYKKDNDSSISIVYSDLKNYHLLTLDGSSINKNDIDFKITNSPVSDYLMNIDENQIIFYAYSENKKILELLLKKVN